MRHDQHLLRSRACAWAAVVGLLVPVCAQEQVGIGQPRSFELPPSCLVGTGASRDVLWFDGVAQSATQEGALADARFNAVQRAMACVAEVLFKTPGYAGIYGAQAIGDYVSSSGHVIESRATTDPRTGAGGFRGFVRFELRRGYFDVSTIRELAFKPVPPANEPEGYSLVPVRLVGDQPTAVEIPARAGRPSQGSFTFVFVVRRLDSGSMSVRLDSIRVVEDGSGGSTRWSFDVFVNGGAPAFTLPATRYDDRVGRYSMPRDKSIETIVRIDNAGWVEIRVSGHRHESLK